MDKNKLKIVLETNEALANAIRRSANEVLTLAIDEVEFHKNDSALYDEILAHRLGLIPLEEGRKLVELKEGDNPNSNNQAQIILKMKGPCVVHSGNFKGEVKAIYDKIPIVILGKDQELELIAFARLGKGKNHAKHSPGLFYYRNTSEIIVKKPKGAKEILDRVKDSLITPIKNNIGAGDVYKSNEDIDAMESFVNKSVEIRPGKDIVMFIESWGQKSSKEVFMEATKVLNENLKAFLKAVK